jgi:hypothetical protein
VTETLDLLKKVLHKIYTRRLQQIDWAIKQKREDFSNNVQRQFQHRVDTVEAKFLQKGTQCPTVKLFPGTRMLIFPFHSTKVWIYLSKTEKSYHHTFHCWLHHKFGLLSVPNKIPDLPKEKAFPNGICPINVKKKWTTSNRSWSSQEFCTFILARETTSKVDQDE